MDTKSLMQSEPSNSPVYGELPLVNEITEETCPEMFFEMENMKGDD